MSISERQAGTWCSLFVAGTVIPRPNHHFLTPKPIEVTSSGHPLEIVILCGTEGFTDAEGEPVSPSWFLSKQELFILREMLDQFDEEGNLVQERTLPTPLEEIDAMVLEMRAEAEKLTQPEHINEEEIAYDA